MKDYLGKDTPKLGFGLMRLPILEDGSGKIDIEQVKKMVDLFMEAGLTYFDTAYVYGNGDSEIACRKALVERYPRESYTVTTKMNAWLGNPTAEEVKDQCRISLERTGLEYFDYYLLHAIQENNYKTYEEYGIWDYVRSLKEQGLIRHWGFSFHAGPDLLDRLLTENPDVELVQLQINYADMEDPSVQARANMEVAQKHGVPFTIMEPVKGGTLANPPQAVREIFKRADPDASFASWAIRYAASFDGVITVLSGMSNIAQMEDNISFMKDFQPMEETDLAVIREAQEALSAIPSIKCTACHYCTDGCPMHIPIPDIFKAMNWNLVYGNLTRAIRNYQAETEKGGKASECIACGQCEGACPQRLPIIRYLQEVTEALEKE